MSEWRLWHGVVAGLAIGSAIALLTPPPPAAPPVRAPVLQQARDAFTQDDSAHDAQFDPPPVVVPTGDGYVNSDGNWRPSPAYGAAGPPPGSSAQCADGTYSFSQHRRGTCSHHGGVASWN